MKHPLIYCGLSAAVLLRDAAAFVAPTSRAVVPRTSHLGSTTEEAAAIINESFAAPNDEIDRRRNLAIISHPDSGKTTMTEKLLLYGGALQQAGAVRMKGEQRATQSDFMEMEKQRGISIRWVPWQRVSYEYLYSTCSSAHDIAKNDITQCHRHVLRLQ